MPIEPVLIAGQWRRSASKKTFRSENPATREFLPAEYPVSDWADCEAALAAAAAAAQEMRALPAETIAKFLEDYAARIESKTADLVAMAHQETGLPVAPRLEKVELPRTTSQLRQAAAAVREASWQEAVIDTKLGLRSCLEPLGPVAVFGPNNFPFAFNSMSGGDFVAAIAAGNPVIGKANSSHPGTTRLLAMEALAAAQAAGLPAGAVQLIYRTEHADGEKLVSDPRIGATAYTGSRGAGLKLKAAADAAGKPIYLELSSINPVVILPGAISARGQHIADEFTTSCLMGTGQFCTNPGLVLLLAGPQTEQFIEQLAERFNKAAVGTLLSKAVARSLEESVGKLKSAGAQCLAGGSAGGGTGHSHGNTLLRVSGKQFLANPHDLQTEAFGNESLLVVADTPAEAATVLDQLEGNLTGAIYSDTDGADDSLHDQLVPHLRPRVGRLLNDKMPTGVAVSPAMNHGGPYPATGHPGFTAVGIPAALRRFAMLCCYDSVRPSRLPSILQDKNPTGRTWRCIDGVWSRGDVGGK